MDVRQVFQLYRQRFGIESCYRQMNPVRARTSSRKPALRLLLLGLALILVNLYISLRQALRSRPAPVRGARRTGLTLRRLASLLAHAIEAFFGLAAPIQVRPLNAFS
jgi:putative transposase